MAKPQVVLFHEALHRIVAARGLVGERAEKARSAISCYMRILRRAASLGGDAAGINRTMVDAALVEIEDRLKQWRLLGSDTALVCDAALAVIRRERVENFCERRITGVLPLLDRPHDTRAGGLLA
jgi:hypothetical protein